MKFIISPAKTFKVQPTPFTPTTLQSHSLTEKLLKKLKQLKHKQLEAIFSISHKLAQQTYDAIHLGIIQPAIFYYHGEAFKSLQVSEMSDKDIHYIQEHVYIYSALYGLLRPLDGIQFYRFDFLSPLDKIGVNKAHKTIKKEVTFKLLNEDNDVIVLVCSQEYKNMIDLKKLQEHKKLIDISFISIQNAKEKIVSVHAKQARGLYLKHCTSNNVKCIEDLLNIDSFNGWNIDTTSSTPTLRIYKKEF